MLLFSRMTILTETEIKKNQWLKFDEGKKCLRFAVLLKFFLMSFMKFLRELSLPNKFIQCYIF